MKKYQIMGLKKNQNKEIKAIQFIEIIKQIKFKLFETK